MELKNGYKQTEVGVIPEDWIPIKFTDCADLKHGFQFREEHFSSNGIKVVKIGNLKYTGELDLNNITFIPNEDLSKFSNFLLSIGDILMALTGATLGKCSIVRSDELLLQNYRVGNFKNKNNSTKEYVYVLLQSDYIQKTIKKLVNEAAQPNLGKGDFDKFIVPLPPTKAEQTAIATALSDMDELINNLATLIEKKKAIKQGAMQQLLQPKEGWVVKKLGEVFEFKQGVQCAVEEQSLNNGEKLKRFVRIIDLTQPNELPRYIADPGSSHHINKKDLFMVRYGSPGLLGYGYEGVIANNLFRLMPKIKINNSFYYQLLSYKNEDIFKLTSSTTMAALNFTALKELLLAYPIDIEEQNRIATIFTDMDNEIQSLEQNLSKYKLLKQGMMQELLTGKIRLV